MLAVRFTKRMKRPPIHMLSLSIAALVESSSDNDSAEDCDAIESW